MSDHGSTKTKTELEVSPGDRGAQAGVRHFLYLVLEGENALAGGARFDWADLDEVLVGRRTDGESRRQVSRTRVGGKRRLEIRGRSGYLSREHARFYKTPKGVMVENLSGRNSVFVNGAKIADPVLLNPGDVIGVGRLFFMTDSDETEPMDDISIEDVSSEPAGFLTLYPSLASRLARLRQEARRNTTITLVGETGTGKEVLARSIHAMSGRPGAYVAINLGGELPRELIQSELFGHVKGAFSGATSDRPGRVRDSNRGTLLLDEVVAAPPEIQTALLRVLQEHEVVPLGSKGPVAVDVRFIAAAQRPLAEVVAEGTFRRDLRPRLEAFVFELPPLRARLADVGVLVASKLRTMGVTENDRPRLSLQAAHVLLRHPWPLNIRELTSKIEVAWGNNRDGEIGDADLPQLDAEDASPRSRLQQQLVSQLRAARGNVAEVARRMGRSRPLVYNWLKRFGIDPESFRSG